MNLKKIDQICKSGAKVILIAIAVLVVALILLSVVQNDPPLIAKQDLNPEVPATAIPAVEEQKWWPVLHPTRESVIDYIWQRESRRGEDKRCWEIGPDGEYGEFQITPIFVRDVRRISGYEIIRSDYSSCVHGINIWLDYWLPRVGAVDLISQYELYNRGPTGYRKWRKELENAK